MKLLHTSDWHLGQIFMGKSREKEHKQFLKWLLDVIKEENIIKKIERTGCFTIEDLNNIFPISINSKPPYYLYPFDLEDYDLFKQHILHKLIKYALETKEFTLDELLRDIHPMWDYIHTEKSNNY